jgi:hypothetical protein
MGEDTAAKNERLRYSAAPMPIVEIERWLHAYHANAIELGPDTSLPLSPRKVRDVVSLRSEFSCEVAIPELCAADGVRVQTVVDDADPHSGQSLV